MIRNLRRRFICFSVLVISIILLVLCLLVFFRQESGLSAGRLSATLVIGITLVALGSWLLSKAAIAPVQKAWQKQLDFTADASHELRTPLAVIRTNLELVMDSSQESVESQMKWLENIEVESSRMTRLIDDLLTLSRADTNRQVVEQREFILEEALGEALLPLEAAARQKGIGMHTDFPRDTIICGDRDRMKQLAVILVNNAILYSDAGACVTVAVSDGTRRTERRTGCRSRQGVERRATHWVELRVREPSL